MRALIASLLGFVLLVGCGEDEPAPATSTPAAEPEPSPSEDEADAPDEEEEPISDEEALAALEAAERPSREDRTRLAGLLARGRRAAQEGEHAEALRIFDEGLEIAHDHQPLLAEAGWAAFNAEDERASELLMRAMRLQGPARRLGAIYYNLGRLHERDAEQDASAREAAVGWYRRSLDIRPDNAETRRRYEALAGESYEETVCPPSERYASIEAFCAALLEVNYDAPFDEEDRIDCGVRPEAEEPLAVPTEGEGPGELVVIDDESSYSGAFTRWYLALSRDEHIEVLGALGSSWDRSCSFGSVEIEHARWQPAGEGPPRLVVELHSTGEYFCGPSPWDECMERVEQNDGDAAECEHEADDNVERTDERHRMICVDVDGRYRCSLPGSPLDGIPDSARPGPIPEGPALERILACPPG